MQIDREDFMFIRVSNALLTTSLFLGKSSREFQMWMNGFSLYSISIFHHIVFYRIPIKIAL